VIILAKKEEVQTLQPVEGRTEDQQIAVNPIVMPVVTAEQAVEAWNTYQDLCRKLLVGSDFQPISGKSFKKKSAWRKLATAFNISVEVIKEERKEYAIDGKTPYFVWEVSAKATAMNGRSMSGLGSCASNERQFAHVEHDVRATAETRAKNRAISDLIGAGEVSAEEMEGTGNVQKPAPRPQAPKPQGESTDGKPHMDFCPNGVDHSTLKVFTVNKEGPNKGKKFIHCDPKNGGCSYWTWMKDQVSTEEAAAVFADSAEDVEDIEIQ
jgi:hypothetical protein